MRDQLKKITEETLVPISLVVLVIGLVSWATRLDARVAASEKELADVKTVQQDYNKSVQSIEKSIVRIETLLKAKGE